MFACSTIQYCDESFNGAKVICRWRFRERVIFYIIPSYSWKAYPSHSHLAAPYLNLWLLFLMSRNTAVGKIMKEFIVIFSQEILSVFWYDSHLMDRPAGGYRFLVFLLLVLLNCPPNMCRTLKLFDQLHKKWILCNVLKTSLVY